MKRIPLNNGLTTLVDDEDFSWLSQWEWVVPKCEGRGKYVRRKSDRKSMHRLILGLSDPDIHSDHINGDTLDNRRRNLRACSRAENMRNKGAQRNCKSGVRGVYFCRRHKVWKASIYRDNVAYYLGSFARKIDAVAARLEAEKVLHGEFSRNHRHSAPNVTPGRLTTTRKGGLGGSETA